MLFKVEEKVKEAAEISMGTEISEEDISNINHLCQQVVEIQVSFFLKLIAYNLYLMMKNNSLDFISKSLWWGLVHEVIMS